MAIASAKRRKGLVLSAAPRTLYGPSGASAHLRGGAPAFAALGNDVRVVLPCRQDPCGAVDDDLAVQVITCEPRESWWMPRRFRKHRELWDGRRLVDIAVQEAGVADLIWERYSQFCDDGLRLARYTTGDTPAWFCPLKVLEYKTQGVTVVAADIDDCSLLVADGSGEVVASEDPVRWAEAIHRQATEARLRRVRHRETVVRQAPQGWGRMQSGDSVMSTLGMTSTGDTDTDTDIAPVAAAHLNGDSFIYDLAIDFDESLCGAHRVPDWTNLDGRDDAQIGATGDDVTLQGTWTLTSSGTCARPRRVGHVSVGSRSRRGVTDSAAPAYATVDNKYVRRS